MTAEFGKSILAGRRVVMPDIGDGDIDVQPFLNIDPDTITEAMAEHPARYHWFASIAAAAVQDAKDAKYKLKAMQEDLYEHYLEELKKKGEKRPSEARIKVAVNTDRRVRKLFELERKRSRRAALLQVMCKALEEKKGLLQSLGAMTRQERESEIRTYNKQVTNARKARVNKGDSNG